jgi:ribosomal-protein-alanine N-acetyltransferase
VEGKLNPPALVRPLVPRDLEAVLAIEMAARPWTTHWTPESYLGALGAGMRAWVAEFEGRVTGFILIRTMVAKDSSGPAGEAEILNLAVQESARRLGVGRALVETALGEAFAQGAGRAFLEVRESNAVACALYTALGFRAASRRPRYYRDPDEDALILQIDLPLPSRA